MLQDALRQLWKLAYPNRDIPSLKSERWKEMGWQGPDPSTDFRYAGMNTRIFLKSNWCLIATSLIFCTHYAHAFETGNGNTILWDTVLPPFCTGPMSWSALIIISGEGRKQDPTTTNWVMFV